LRRREQAYRSGRPATKLAAQTVILVDDGLATGATMHVAALAVLDERPARLVVAVPTAPTAACRELSRVADEVICVDTPAPFVAVGMSYRDFHQVSDEEVQALLC
jgi:putative phosphoribosyl transferase